MAGFRVQPGREAGWGIAVPRDDFLGGEDGRERAKE